MIAIGWWLFPVAAALAVLSLVGYVGLHRGREQFRRPARFAFYAAVGCLQVAAALLLNAILTHRFDLEYVFGHSSTDLPYLYLVSTFWSGQEGTFALWSLYAGFIGMALIARSREWEGTIMAIWCAILLMVLGMVLVKSPFAPTDLSHFSAADQELMARQFGGIPPEGQGLNPLLQNPWMVIHPPILFLGFALMAVPYAFALAGLIRREHDGWLHRAQGWTLFGFAVLGLGLILGGYWAYETLGWGGYWAWDPVENSSLVPWLYSGALFHGLLLQRASGGEQRGLNYALAALTFVSVTFGSYLNRSGVLSDFSVHSFVALSEGFNRALMAFAVVPLLAFAAIYGLGRPREAAAVAPSDALTRRQMLHWVTLLLAGSATVVLIGNSWPLVSHGLSLVPGIQNAVPQASSLQQPFYNTTHTPLAAVLAVLLSFALLTGWKETSRQTLLVGLRLPLAIAGACGGLVAYGIYYAVTSRAATPGLMPATASSLAFAWGSVVTLCCLAAAVNLRLLVEEYRRGQRWSLGTHTAHAGFMVMVIGIVASSVYETKTMVELPANETKSFFGYQITYAGLIPRGENGEVRLIVRHGAKQTLLTPILRPTRDGIVWNPGILKTVTHDLYLEPGEIRPAVDPESVPLRRDEPLEFAGSTIEFVRFDLGTNHTSLDPQAFSVKCELKVTRDGRTTTVIPTFGVKDGQLIGDPAALPGGGQLRVVQILPEQDTLLLSFGETAAMPAPETAVVQATIKPAMSIVWLGCWMTIAGAMLAAARRAREAVRRR